MSKPKGIFLVAIYAMKPKGHVNTSRKGWMDNPDNIRYDEQVAITRGLRTKDMHAQVVLDLSSKVIVKNSFDTGKSFDEIFRYFLENYTEYMAQTMSQLDPVYLADLAKLMEAEMQPMPEPTPEAVVVDGVQDAVINAETQAQ
jgi:hypothetical protein